MATSHHFETLQVHAGQERPDSATGARAVPIYQTTSYVFANCDQAEARFTLNEAGPIYGRLTNPTQEVFEARMAALEGGCAALATASGAAAITYALQNLTQQGDSLVAASTLYGGTYSLLAHTFPCFGVTTRFVAPNDLTAAEAAITETTKALYIESLGNPTGNPVDIAAWAELAHRYKIPLVVDNTFATPWLLRPIDYGASIVVHSATKFIGGHGTSLGGVLVESGTFDWAASGKFPQFTEPSPSYDNTSFCAAFGNMAFSARARAVLLRDMGASLSPFNAFLLLQGLETLSLRVDRQVANTLAIVDFLQTHPRVAHVNHPHCKDHPDHALYTRYFPRGGGSIFTFEVKGGAKEARACIDKLRLFSLLANVADVKSLVIHPASTTHAQVPSEKQRACGIYPNTIRLSIGIEHCADLIDDLSYALA